MTNPHTNHGRPLVRVVYGSRPEVIEMAPVMRPLELREEVETVGVFTGQHRELATDLFDHLGMDPGLHRYRLLCVPGWLLQEDESRTC